MVADVGQPECFAVSGQLDDLKIALYNGPLGMEPQLLDQVEPRGGRHFPRFTVDRQLQQRVLP